jgi:hypothetical protein
MNIKISSEQELIEVATEAIRVLANLRKFTMLWEESHGVVLKDKKKVWEARADKLIDKLQVPELGRNEHVKIELDA